MEPPERTAPSTQKENRWPWTATTRFARVGLWVITYAFSQAIEAIFYFLGTRNDQEEDYGIELIHSACVLIAGGFAFTHPHHAFRRAIRFPGF